MKLSVIIPVYRVESTLDRCVESVLAQQVDGMEVILVDDGSPDRCPMMCDEWQRRDQRISVIHKANGGLSDARNAGLDRACGEYVTFVDSDDYVAPDTYGPALQTIGDADIMEYPVAGRLPLGCREYSDTGEYWRTEQVYTHTYAWNKIYRRTLFSGIRYPKGRIFEDVYTLPLLLRAARKVRTTDRGCYHYCYNPAGITATADGEGLAQLLDAHLSGGMPMDDRYYLYLLNIQSDVWEATRTPLLLTRRHVDTTLFHGISKLKAITNNLFGIKFICRTNSLLHLVKKPARW